jgi:ribosome biogenesis protein UTP30
VRYRLRTCIKTAGPARLAPPPFFPKSIRVNGLLPSSVKFGTLSQSPDQVLVNLKTALPAIIAAVHGGWDNVQSLGIKSSKSTSLPIWTCKLGNDEGARWHGLTLGAEDGEDSEDDELTKTEAPATKPAKAAEQAPAQGGKKQKRAAEATEPPAQKKPKKVPSEPTTMGPLTSPKPRKGSKVRTRLGVEPCH